LNEAEIVFSYRPYREDLGSIHSCSHDFQSDFCIPLYRDLLLRVDEAGRRSIRVKLHVRWYQVTRDKDCQRSNLRKEAHLIDVSDDTIDGFAFERSIYDCSILHDEFCHSSAWLYGSFADFENTQNGDDVSQTARACSFDIRVKLVSQIHIGLRAEIGRMKVDGVL